MAITNPPYAYDIVGSFLRPEALKQAPPSQTWWKRRNRRA